MDFRSSSRSGIGNLVTALGLTGLLAILLRVRCRRHKRRGAGGDVPLGPASGGSGAVEITLRNCDDPSVTLGPPFRSIVTFAEGGTIVESAGALSSPPASAATAMAPGAGRVGTPIASACSP